MIKFNIVFAALSLISGIGNIYVGMNRPPIEGFDWSVWPALIQIFLAALTIISGLSRLKFFYVNGRLAALHPYFAFLFYSYIFAMVFYVFFRQ